MKPIAKSEYTYSEFCDFARHFNQIGLLTSIARRAAALFDKDASDQAYLQTPPWSLAALAKASLVHGNPYRSVPVREKDVRYMGDVHFGCAIYSNIMPEEMSEPSLGPVFNLLVRMAYEQFPCQESPYAELARVDAFFTGYSGRHQLEVLGDESISELLGAPPRVAVGVAMLLLAVTLTNDGIFEPSALEGEGFSQVLAELTCHQIEAVVDASFATDLAGFRRLAANAPNLEKLERYMFNPLTARPLLRLDDGRLLAPVPQLIGRRLSPIELYYEGLSRWGVAFTRDLGELLEDYVGRQFQTLPHAAVHPEVVYVGKTKKEGQKKSIDWFVIFDDLVLLVEAKATRLIAGGRAGADGTREAIVKTFSEALQQLDRTHKAILDGIPEFAHIPTDRPFIGLVATLDSFYVANSGLAREFLHQPRIPWLNASARAIETLVAIGQRRSASEVLRLISGNTEMATWDLDTSLFRYQEPSDSNPILEAAWKALPFNPASGDPARG